MRLHSARKEHRFEQKFSMASAYQAARLGNGEVCVWHFLTDFGHAAQTRYTPAFIDNDIDVEVLRYLTDADLEKIGVSRSLQPRGQNW